MRWPSSGGKVTKHNDSGNSCSKKQRREGRYANYFEVGHNEFEFVIDFGQFYGDDNDVQRHTRIITNPAYMKTLLELLIKSNGEYEKTFGAIKSTAKGKGR